MPGQKMEEVLEVVSVLSGDIQTQDKGDGRVTLGNEFEALAELGITSGGLDELKFSGGRLKVLVEEGGVVAVTRGVDTDADADGGTGSWWGSSHGMRRHNGSVKRLKTRCSREGPPTLSDEEESCDKRSWPQDATST
jgi:hypothetical protein